MWSSLNKIQIVNVLTHAIIDIIQAPSFVCTLAYYAHSCTGTCNIGACFNRCCAWKSNCLATLSCLWPKAFPHDRRSSCINWLVNDQFIFSHCQQPQCFPGSYSHWQATHWTLCRMVFLLRICKHFHFAKQKFH